MKNVFNWILVAVCLFTVGNVQVMADDKKEDAQSVSIPLIVGKPFDEADLAGGQGGTGRRHDILNPGLMEGDDIGITFYQIAFFQSADGILGFSQFFPGGCAFHGQYCAA